MRGEGLFVRWWEVELLEATVGDFAEDWVAFGVDFSLGFGLEEEGRGGGWGREVEGGDGGDEVRKGWEGLGFLVGVGEAC